MLYASTDQPTTWPIVSSIFAEALAGNVTSLYNAIISPFSSPLHLTQTDLSRAAVSCADSPPYKSKKDWPTAEFMTNKTLYNLEQSPHFGARRVMYFLSWSTGIDSPLKQCKPH